VLNAMKKITALHLWFSHR